MNSNIQSKGTAQVLPGRNIIKSAGTGTWTVEDVNLLTQQILSLSKKFRGLKWGYIADPTKMNPLLSKDVSAAFTEFHKKLHAAGCVAIAFLDGNTAAMKLQTQKHQNKAQAQELSIGHFKTEQEAVEWLTKLGIK